MSNNNLTLTLLVDQSPEEVFNAINNVRGWWSEKLEGNSAHTGDEFIFRHKDIHYSKHKLTEIIPNKKVVWLITDGYLSFIEHKTEWIGTTVTFEITEEEGKTKLVFIHHGLTPEAECFDACTLGWTHFITKSLYSLITTGEGYPDKG